MIDDIITYMPVVFIIDVLLVVIFTITDPFSMLLMTGAGLFVVGYIWLFISEARE
jgi:hypothetical protein